MYTERCCPPVQPTATGREPGLLAWYSGTRPRTKVAMSAISVATLVCVSRKRMTSGSRPVRLRSPGSQYGFGRARASNTKSASAGMPRLKPNDSKVSDKRPAPRCSTRLWMMSRSACTDRREVSISRSATEAIGSSSARSSALPSRRPPPQQLVLGRDQEHHLALQAAAPELVDQLWNARYLGGRITCIQADRRELVGGLGTAHGVGDERLEQRGRDVVDAVEPQVLEHVQRHALAGAGQPAEDDDAHGTILSGDADAARGSAQLTPHRRSARASAAWWSPRFSLCFLMQRSSLSTSRSMAAYMSASVALAWMAQPLRCRVASAF